MSKNRYENINNYITYKFNKFCIEILKRQKNIYFTMIIKIKLK